MRESDNRNCLKLVNNYKETLPPLNGKLWRRWTKIQENYQNPSRSIRNLIEVTVEQHQGCAGGPRRRLAQYEWLLHRSMLTHSRNWKCEQLRQHSFTLGFYFHRRTVQTFNSFNLWIVISEIWFYNYCFVWRVVRTIHKGTNLLSPQSQL